MITKNHDKKSIGSVSVSVYRAGWYKSPSFHSIDDFLRRPFSDGLDFMILAALLKGGEM